MLLALGGEYKRFRQKILASRLQNIWTLLPFSLDFYVLDSSSTPPLTLASNGGPNGHYTTTNTLLSPSSGNGNTSYVICNNIWPLIGRETPSKSAQHMNATQSQKNNQSGHKTRERGASIHDTRGL